MKKRWVLLMVLMGSCFAATGAEPTTDTPAYRGKPSVDGGVCCQTLGEVRTHIDSIDEKIIALMAERQKYVSEAARFKANPAEVEAPARVEAVLNKVTVLSKKDGLDPGVARATYRTMITGFTGLEQQLYKNSEKH